MFPSTLLTTLILALAVAANPIVVDQPKVTLPLVRRLNLTSVHNLLRHDQSRAKALKARGSASTSLIHTDAAISETVDNKAVSYYASVSVGSPPTTCKSLPRWF